MRDLGDHYLKDLPRPQRLFQVDVDGLPNEFPPLGTRAAAGVVATLLYIDLAGWTRVMGDLGDDGAAAAAAAYHRIVAQTASANDGVEVERIADSAMCVFFSAKDAIVAAATIRAELHRSDWIQGTEKPDLVGAVHTGRVTSLAGGQLGSPAVRAFQLWASATPGQILVSHTTHAILEGELLGELALRDLGERELDGKTPQRVFELLGSSTSH
jgi:class 3 adenylate cyclase